MRVVNVSIHQVRQHLRNGHHLLQESNRELITLEIERSGGSVSSVGIQYRASPIGESSFVYNY